MRYFEKCLSVLCSCNESPWGSVLHTGFEQKVIKWWQNVNFFEWTIIMKHSFLWQGSKMIYLISNCVSFSCNTYNILTRCLLNWETKFQNGEVYVKKRKENSENITQLTSPIATFLTFWLQEQYENSILSHWCLDMANLNMCKC